MPEAPQKQEYLVLPLGVVNAVDVGRLVREVEGLDEFLRQSAVREPGTAVKLPRTTRLMDELIQANAVNPLQPTDRQRLHDFLVAVKDEAPRLHISFSADPSPLFVQRLMDYLRKEIHPLLLVQVGLQPTIGAGCVLRTTNKFFDFSLRHRFKEKRALLTQQVVAILNQEAKTTNQQVVSQPEVPVS